MGEYADVEIKRQQLEREDRVVKESQKLMAPGILTKYAVAHTVHNNGEHIVCHARNGHLVDYWPGPNKWHVRKLGQTTVGAPWKRGFTLKALIKFCKE